MGRKKYNLNRFVKYSFNILKILKSYEIEKCYPYLTTVEILKSNIPVQLWSISSKQNKKSKNGSWVENIVYNKQLLEILVKNIENLKSYKIEKFCPWKLN